MGATGNMQQQEPGRYTLKIPFRWDHTPKDWMKELVSKPAYPLLNTRDDVKEEGRSFGDLEDYEKQKIVDAF